MRRNEIRLVNLDPVVGNEAARTRPGVIVSNDGVAIERVGRLIGNVPFHLMEQDDEAIRLHLNL